MQCRLMLTILLMMCDYPFGFHIFWNDISSNLIYFLWIWKSLEPGTGPEHDFVNTGQSQQVALFCVDFCQCPINSMAHLQYTSIPNNIFLSASICILFHDIFFSAFMLQLDTSSQWVLTYSVWNSANITCHYSWIGLMSWKSPFLPCQLELQKDVVTVIVMGMQDADGAG